MRQIVKSALAGILNALLITTAAFGAGGGVGNYPQTLPAQTVVGRLGLTPGPTQAIPISQLAGVFGARQSVTTNAKCDGATDDTTAINADLALGGYWTLPPNRTCNVTQLNITLSGTRLSGSGFNTSILQGTTAAAPSINISAGLSNVYLDGFQVTKSVVATSGGTGIRMGGDCQYCVIDGVFVQKHYVGIQLQSTGVGYLRHVLSQYNLSTGISLTNSAASGTVQWDLDDVFSAQNVGQGFLVTTGAAGPTAITLGSWHNIRTFANTSIGIGVVCSVTIPCNGFRLTKGFLGNDNNHGIYLDSYGGLHTIADSYVELSATSTSGPTLSTPATNSGDGIRITANNTDVSLANLYINGNATSGINTSATVSTNVSGYRISNHTLYGIISANCALLTVTGINFVTNTTANLLCSSNNGSQLIATSTPSSLNTYTPSPIPANTVTRAMEAQGVARSVIGVTGNATANVADIQGATDQILRINGAGTALAFGSIDLSKSAAVGSSILPAANGGRGSASQYAVLNAAPANPTGTASTTVLMMGLGTTCTITPVISTRVRFTIFGSVNNNTAGDFAKYQMAYGLVSLPTPTNGQAAAGTVFGSAPVSVNLASGGGASSTPFSVSGIATGLSPATAYWFDIQLAAITGGTASVQSLGCSAEEL